jgi:hypothetical protein
MNLSSYRIAALCATILAALVTTPGRSRRLHDWEVRRTLGTLLYGGTALELHSVLHGTFPERALCSFSSLRPVLEPDLARPLTVVDGFGHDIMYLSDGALFILWSTGANGLPDVLPGGGPTHSRDADIVLVNTIYGKLFWQGPAGFSLVGGAGNPSPFEALSTVSPTGFYPARSSTGARSAPPRAEP